MNNLCVSGCTRRVREASIVQRFLLAETAILITVLGFGQAQANPSWYDKINQRGYRENVADFYQHQYWKDDPVWEAGGGWCRPVAIANSLYSFQAQGMWPGLLPADVDQDTKWQQAACDGIKEIAKAVFGTKGVQGYLDDKGYAREDVVSLKYTRYNVDSAGNATYLSSDGTKKNVGNYFDLYQRELLSGQDVMVRIGAGTNTDADRWWGNYHYVTGVGFDKKKKEIYFADPDSNKGSTRDKAGWKPRRSEADINGLKYNATDTKPPVPGPRTNPTDAPPGKEKFYGSWKLGPNDKVSGDAVNERYKGVSIDAIETICPDYNTFLDMFQVPTFDGIVGVSSFAAVPTQTVDSIILFPTSPVEASAPMEPIFQDDSGDFWERSYISLDGFDPFGNSRPFGGVQFDVVSGLGLDSGEDSLDAQFGIQSSFTDFDMMYHVAGTDDWLVQTYGPPEELYGPQIPISESGDFNHDGIVNDVDIDLLRIAINTNSPDPIYDVNGGGLDSTDFDYQVQAVIGSAFGDADLNQQINFTDFVFLSTNFGSSGTGWGQGNFNLDDITNFADFVFLANNYGNDLSRGVLVQETVPEPVSLVLLSLAVSFVVARRRGGDGQ